MASMISPVTAPAADSAALLLLLQEQEANAIKLLSETRARIAVNQTELAALEFYHDQRTKTHDKIRWIANKEGVTFHQMMHKYAWNRLLEMEEELISLSRKKLPA
jgi:predicted acetyltransferase